MLVGGWIIHTPPWVFLFGTDVLTLNARQTIYINSIPLPHMVTEGLRELRSRYGVAAYKVRNANLVVQFFVEG